MIIEERFNAIPDQGRPYGTSVSGSRQLSSEHQQSAVRAQEPRIVQLQPDMIVVPMSVLNQIIEEKVKLRVKQFEESMRSSQMLEMRVKQLEDSLILIGKSSV